MYVCKCDWVADDDDYVLERTRLKEKTQWRKIVGPIIMEPHLRLVKILIYKYLFVLFFFLL